MNRRVLLKNILLSTGGMVILPAWAKQWSPAKLNLQANYLPSFESELLSSLVETIIPTTDTPGAKDLGVDSLIQKILVDCYEVSVQEDFKKGLLEVEKLSTEKTGVSFTKADTQQRLLVLKEMETQTAALLKQLGEESGGQRGQAAQRRAMPFFALLKDLTILGYTNSEYVMTKLTGYVAVPGHYHGCVPYTSKKPA